MTAPPARWWHGGYPDLLPGQLLLPPVVTGTRHNLADTTVRQFGATAPHVDRGSVYVTTDKQAAMAFAAFYTATYGRGALYVVEPSLPLTVDPDAVGISWRCPSAEILSVYDPCVRMGIGRAIRILARSGATP